MPLHTLSSDISSSAPCQADTCTAQTLERLNRPQCQWCTVCLVLLLTLKSMFRSECITVKQTVWIQFQKKFRKSGNHNYKKAPFRKNTDLNTSCLSYTFGHLGVCFQSECLVCINSVFTNMWKGLWGLQCDTDNVIPTAVNSCSPSISISTMEPSCCIVGSLACNASAVYSVYWGAAWQFKLCRDALEGIST